MHTFFEGIFTTSTITVTNFLLCLFVSLAIGMFLALIYDRKLCSRSFLVTLALLPAVVCVVIMMVNGNVGAGVAVAGAFSLVRFRSVPGTAREIATLFLAMAAGLICGMGYLGFALLFSLILGLAMYGLNHFAFPQKHPQKILRITIPEDLNYSDVFDDIFTSYTSTYNLVSVKTSNMGSLFKLQYHVTLKDDMTEKAFIDALRCRNGNLEISIARQEANTYELSEFGLCQNNYHKPQNYGKKHCISKIAHSGHETGCHRQKDRSDVTRISRYGTESHEGKSASYCHACTNITVHHQDDGTDGCWQ